MNWFAPKSKVGLVWAEGWWDGGANAGLRRSVVVEISIIILGITQNLTFYFICLDRSYLTSK